jgi:hypothetical protein
MYLLQVSQHPSKRPSCPRAFALALPSARPALLQILILLPPLGLFSTASEVLPNMYFLVFNCFAELGMEPGLAHARPPALDYRTTPTAQHPLLNQILPEHAASLCVWFLFVSAHSVRKALSQAQRWCLRVAGL